MSDEDIRRAMTQDLPLVSMTNDPRLRARLPPHAENNRPSSVSQSTVTSTGPTVITASGKRSRRKKVPAEKQTQFYCQVVNEELELSYLCQMKSKLTNSLHVSKESVAANESLVAINSMAYSPDGTIVAASTCNDTIVVLDLKQEPSPGKVVNPVKKYGANLMKMLVNEKAVHASTRTDNDIRLLDLPHHTYVRYFKGHTSTVGSLDVTSEGRTLLSASAMDRKLFLWDLDREQAIACIRLQSGLSVRQWDDSVFGLKDLRPRLLPFPQPVVAFDPTNSIFANSGNTSASTT